MVDVVQFAEYFFPKDEVGMGQFTTMPDGLDSEKRIFDNWEKGLVKLGEENWEIACFVPSNGPTNHKFILQRRVKKLVKRSNE